MKVERFEIPGLAQYSYVVSDGGEAAVIDPIRDIERYVGYAAEIGVRITNVLETHIHADFAAGTVALADASGAEIAVSAYDDGERFQYAMAHRGLSDGDSVQVGGARLEAMHTPGHTPEHLSFLLYDAAGSEPVAMFSGDFLFAGSLGRPDLLGEEAKVGLARALYRSLNERLVGLPDALTVYPGHGAGSLCGAGMSGRVETTLGYERSTNPFFRYGEEEFVEKILASAPAMPDYYPRMKEFNAQGAPVLHGLPGGEGLGVEDVAKAARDEAFVVIDLRAPEAFAHGHIGGAINLGGGTSLSLWAGWLLDSAKQIVLVGDEGDEGEARLSLVRVGLDRIAGHLGGGMAAWTAAGLGIVRSGMKTAGEVAGELANTFVLDVRNDQELHEGVIPGSRHVMLGDLRGSLGELPREAHIVTVCGGGYRASVAASLLQRAGFADVSVMQGGMAAWLREGLNVD